ncbi:unnamed protein product [Cyprideis torosa]|uniref:Peptidase S1 domain-containing protein n=1 Tax=Cyprideis torosa TaxID=163714 RepID=A0A7R8WBN7_9CRUS|nr:unnamed protein product [Cyprideis torosa]CAG0892502.1 unnamed protein product [Cyprideis torosa]
MITAERWFCWTLLFFFFVVAVTVVHTEAKQKLFQAPFPESSLVSALTSDLSNRQHRNAYRTFILKNIFSRLPQSLKLTRSKDESYVNPYTVVTFEPKFPCPRMKSRQGNPFNEPPVLQQRRKVDVGYKVHFGVDVEEGEMPFLVRMIILATNPNTSIGKSCTGCIWSRNHVGTAAHCLHHKHHRWVLPTPCNPPDRSCEQAHICASSAGGGVCNGDSGGPFLAHDTDLDSWVQVGINFLVSSLMPGDKCSSPSAWSTAETLFYFGDPGPKSPMGNPWCDFITKHIDREVYVVKGDANPSDFCDSPRKRFSWCDVSPP